MRASLLFESWSHYEKPMLVYLNSEMAKNRGFDSDRAIRFKTRFPEVTRLINENLRRPFRPRSVINSAMLEAVVVALLEDPAIDGDQLKTRYQALAEDKNFATYLRGATTDTKILRARISRAKEVLSDASV